MKKIFHICLCMFIPVILNAQVDNISITCTDLGYESPFLQTEDFECDPNYVLVFEDEFDGEDLDETKWWSRSGPVRGWDENYGFGSSMNKQYYTPDNIELQNGKLKLKADDSGLLGTWVVDWGPPIVEHTDWFDYTSGEIDSKRRFHYGFYEIKCSLPSTRGFYPAFWIFGDPIWSEIDCFEINTTTNDHQMTVHYDHDSDGNSDYCAYAINSNDHSNMHIYGFEWTQTHISFYVDGNHKWNYIRYRDEVTQQDIGCESINAPRRISSKKLWPTEAGEIIANLAVLNNEHSPDGSTEFPSYYEIEYVKYWRSIKNPEPKIVNHTTDLDLDEIIFNTFAGDYIQLSTNIILTQNDQLSLIGQNYVKLLPGVQINKGAEVNIWTEDLMVSKSNNKNNTPAVIKQKEAVINNLEDNLNCSIYPNLLGNEILTINFDKVVDDEVVVIIYDYRGIKHFEDYFRSVSEINYSSSHLGLDAGFYIIRVLVPEYNFANQYKLIVSN